MEAIGNVCNRPTSVFKGRWRARCATSSQELTGQTCSGEGAKTEFKQKIGSWRRWTKLVASAVLLGLIYAALSRHGIQVQRTAVIVQHGKGQSQSVILATPTEVASRKLPVLQPTVEVQPAAILQSQSQIFETHTNVTALKLPVEEHHEAQQHQRRVAICLVGGLRAFELTGPSIRKHVLEEYLNADVFVHAPVDADVHKLTVLSGFPRLASARLFVPETVNESDIAGEVLRARGSPNGIQGLLQYFNLVEGCLGLIENYETRHEFKYDWVVRTRVDGYWNSPIAPIEAFSPSKYHVPQGSNFGGLNDRLGAGTRSTSEVALERMSLLPKIHDLGHRGLNSESAFKAQFKASNVKVELHRFPFCVLSARRYRHRDIPVASMTSKGPLNGAKCRPCTPRLVGEEASIALRAIMPRWSIGSTDEALLCDAQEGWEDGWEQIYDAAAGPAWAEVRKELTGRSFSSCLRDIQAFRGEWVTWSAPPAESLCEGLRLSPNA